MFHAAGRWGRPDGLAADDDPTGTRDRRDQPLAVCCPWNDWRPRAAAKPESLPPSSPSLRILGDFAGWGLTFEDGDRHLPPLLLAPCSGVLLPGIGWSRTPVTCDGARRRSRRPTAADFGTGGGRKVDHRRTDRLGAQLHTLHSKYRPSRCRQGAASEGQSGAGWGGTPRAVRQVRTVAGTSTTPRAFGNSGSVGGNTRAAPAETEEDLSRQRAIVLDVERNHYEALGRPPRRAAT
jgi:hypothetical protein